MTDTPNLGLPCLEAAQAQKHVTLNEALLRLDVLVQARVVSIGDTAPPGSPADGDVYIPGAGATGAWDDWDWNIAYVADGGWVKIVPKEGWTVFNADDGITYRYDPVTFWQPVTVNDAMVFKGVVDCSANPNYPAGNRGDTYRVSVAGKIGGGSGVTVEAGDLVLCLTDGTASGNQATVGASWSIAQANLDGAVIGPASVTDGVPALFDGTTGKLIKATTFSAFKTALALVKADVGLGNVLNVPQREVIAGNRTYYVRADGSDANNGLADNSGGAFLTIQKAVDTVASIDLSAYSVTIQVRSGTYAPVALKSYVGAGPVHLVGDTTTPSNVVIAATAADCIVASGVVGKYHLRGFRLTTATSGFQVNLSQGSVVEIDGNMNYHTCVSHGIAVQSGSLLSISASYSISASPGGAHLVVGQGSVATYTPPTVTLTGTPAWVTAFAYAFTAGAISTAGVTFSGASTGKRYLADANATINTFGSGANYFPGDVAGTVSGDAVYA